MLSQGLSHPQYGKLLKSAAAAAFLVPLYPGPAWLHMLRVLPGQQEQCSAESVSRCTSWLWFIAESDLVIASALGLGHSNL